MRLGVLDVGSNTVHLLVVDAHRGAHPTPMTSEKTVLRLAERIGADGVLAESDADEVVHSVDAARRSAEDSGCEDLMAFATSAIREASNASAVLDRVRAEAGVTLEVLPGEEEARITFLAARRWYGWSAGRLLLADIGGGSLEMAMGVDESPEAAVSLPLGAGRVTRAHLTEDPPSRAEISDVRSWLDAELTPALKEFREVGQPDRVVATSKTFRSLAKLTGSPTLTDSGLSQLLPFITRMSASDLASLDGVSSGRAHQLVGGALIAEAVMRALSLREFDICPWALREGVILRHLDHTNGFDHNAQRAVSPRVCGNQSTGRNARYGARWNR